MREYYKIVFGFLKNYRLPFGLNILFNVLGIIFSLFSLTMLIPFLGILFNTQKLIYELKPWELTTGVISNNLYYFLSQIIIKKGQFSALIYVSIGVIIMLFFKNLFIFFANYHMTAIRNGVMRDIRNQLFKKILRLHVSYFTESKKGDTISRISGDVQDIDYSVMSSIEMMFRDPLNIFIFLIGLMFISVELTIFVLIILPIGGIIVGKIGKSLRKTSAKAQGKMGEIISVVEESLSGLKIIKAFNASKVMQKRFESENEDYTNIFNTLHRRRYLAPPLSEFLGVSIVVAVMLYGGKIVLTHQSALEPQDFIAYLAIFSQIINPAKSFSTAYYNIQKGMASFDRVNSILHAEELIVDPPVPAKIEEFKESIEYKNVSFSYGAQDVLKDINLKIEKGKTIALVGQSGSGKTTLADLLPRFWDIDRGEICIDGENIKNYRLGELYSIMGIVGQEAILFNDTFFNNIAFGLENVSEEDVIKAAKIANAHEFIISTEKGYYSNIGDRGSKLSGGQRQRLSIARAVLKNPPILILDEATSALDTESEKFVQEAITNLMKNRTAIIIAHRLSTIRHADQICVLHEGEIVERGKHEDLLAQNGVYKKLYDLQMF